MKLLVDDEIWIECLNAACSQYSVKMIRDLFITIVSKCESAKPQDLFEKYSEFMMDDFTGHWKLRVENGSCTKHEANQYARNDLLCCLDSEFSKLNKENSDFDLLRADYGMKNTTLEEKEMERERDTDANQFYECNKGLLNESQNSVFKELQLGIDKKGGVYMIDASAGYGKTFLINLLLAYVRKETILQLQQLHLE